MLTHTKTGRIIEKIKRKKREYNKIRDKREVQKYVYSPCVCVPTTWTHT